MTAKRIAGAGRVDHNRSVSFTWDGRQMTGLAGDTVASALLANNETIVGRSFKYHRPRGIMSAGVEESGALVTIGEGARTDPNVKATTAELHAGLVARGQNAVPNVRFDLGAVNSVAGRFLSAGFYYKTFMGIPPMEWGKGTRIWMFYEKLIRNAAGLGRMDRRPDPDSYEHARGFCDLLVVGGGPAGLSAALAATQAGLDVILVEQDFELGGMGLGDSDIAEDCARMITELRASGARIMTRTTAFGLYDGSTAGLLERVTDHEADSPAWMPRQRFWTVTSRHTIVAAGSLERLMAFGDNDRPGVMNASAAHIYLDRFGVLAGENIVVATNNDSVYAGAAAMAQAGASVRVLDARTALNGTQVENARAAGVDITTGTAPLQVRGRKAVAGIDTATASTAGWKQGERFDCDRLLVSGGWSPVVNLQSHRGIRPVWDDANACFVPGECNEPLSMAGACAGLLGGRACIESGEAALKAMLGSVGRRESVRVTQPADTGWENPIEPVYEVSVPGVKTKAFIDPQHDVTCDDVRLAHREGFVSVEHLKRYTTLGMATDQGKMGNILGLALMADALGKDIPEVGTTTFRPPYTPVSIGALSGRAVGEHFKALRRTPMHNWNLERNATMTEAGLWHRPWFYPRDGETITEAYIRETETSRKTVGICDVTSLGKIAIQGPDATEFLNRIYSNPFAKLAIGKARYGIMLRDDGIPMDDGTTWRFSETDYFMTTTTAGAVKVMAWLEELLQTRWQDLRVHVTSVSEQWAGCSLAGPLSRAVLESSVEDSSVMTNDNLPFMGVIETTLKGGIPCRIARISFSGEMAYEAYVPSDYATDMMNLLWGDAEGRDGCLYGTEALGAMRIEKGHVTHAEIDGRVTIEDCGLGKMASVKKHYIGSQLRLRPDLQRDDRPQLVGIFPKDRSAKFNAGALLCAADEISGMGEGWITAVTHSPALGHWIGLGFLSGGHEAWKDRSAVAADPVREGNTDVEIVSPHMYDPSGERMHG